MKHIHKHYYNLKDFHFNTSLQFFMNVLDIIKSTKNLLKYFQKFLKFY